MVGSSTTSLPASQPVTFDVFTESDLSRFSTSSLDIAMAFRSGTWFQIALFSVNGRQSFTLDCITHIRFQSTSSSWWEVCWLFGRYSKAWMRKTLKTIKLIWLTLSFQKPPQHLANVSSSLSSLHATFGGNSSLSHHVNETHCFCAHVVPRRRNLEHCAKLRKVVVDDSPSRPELRQSKRDLHVTYVVSFDRFPALPSDTFLDLPSLQVRMEIFVDVANDCSAEFDLHFCNVAGLQHLHCGEDPWSCRLWVFYSMDLLSNSC